MFVFFVSCKDKNENLVAFSYDPEKVPTIITDTTSSHISLSDTTSASLVADEWQMFQKAKEPFWYFPKGIYSEFYDKDFSVQATIKADSAWFYNNQSLWKLNGNVHIENAVGEQFESEEFFWNQQEGRVYSDKYIEIRRGQMLIKAVGFRSNQAMTDWQILQPYDSRIPFSEQSSGNASQDSLQLIETQPTTE